MNRSTNFHALTFLSFRTALTFLSFRTAAISKVSNLHNAKFILPFVFMLVYLVSLMSIFQLWDIRYKLAWITACF